MWLLFWQLFEEFGLLFIPTPGHTAGWSDLAKIRTSMEIFRRKRWTIGSGQHSSMCEMVPRVSCVIFLFVINTRAYRWFQYSLHLLPKSSMTLHWFFSCSRHSEDGLTCPKQPSRLWPSSGLFLWLRYRPFSCQTSSNGSPSIKNKILY